MRVTIIGAGLAGCEAAWQLAERGIDVTLVEQKPIARTPAQTSDKLCELVCGSLEKQFTKQAGVFAGSVHR